MSDENVGGLVELLAKWRKRSSGFRTTEFGHGKKEAIQECADELEAALSAHGQPVMDGLSDIGQRAVEFVEARRSRMAARRARTAAAIAFYDEHGSDAAYDDQSEHPRGYSQPFIDATGEAQATYETALKVETSKRERLYAAVRKRAAIEGATP